MKEIWKDVIGFEGFYQVSDLGNVRSFVIYRNSTRANPKAMVPCRDSRGYYNFTVKKCFREKRTLYIHREVAKAFKPNPNNYKLVRHLNDVKTDNRVNNLAWGTYQHNRIDGIRNGKFPHEIGKRPVVRKLNEAKVGMVMMSPKNNSELGRELNVSESTISKIRVGRNWNHVTKLPRIK